MAMDVLAMTRQTLPGVLQLMGDFESQGRHRWADSKIDDHAKTDDRSGQNHPVDGHGAGLVPEKLLERIHADTPLFGVTQRHNILCN
jgi:hypothetical protein